MRMGLGVNDPSALARASRPAGLCGVSFRLISLDQSKGLCGRRQWLNFMKLWCRYIFTF